MERLKAFSVEKFTLDGIQFHTLTFLSAKYLLRVLLTQLGLYSLYAWPLVPLYVYVSTDCNVIWNMLSLCGMCTMFTKLMN